MNSFPWCRLACCCCSSSLATNFFLPKETQVTMLNSMASRCRPLPCRCSSQVVSKLWVHSDHSASRSSSSSWSSRRRFSTQVTPISGQPSIPPGFEVGQWVDPEEELELPRSFPSEVTGTIRQLQLNEAFWGRFKSIPEMATATDKEEILHILENFVLVNRQHVVLCQRLKATVIRRIDEWTAPELALLCRSFAELSYLHEDLLLAMTEQVVSTVSNCTAQELCLLLDAYATKRCLVQSVTDAVTEQTLMRLEEFTPSQLCLHASSYTRLGMQNEELMRKISSRIIEALYDTQMEPGFSARDICILAHAFAKLGEEKTRDIFNMLSRAALPVMRDFTAKELQSLLVSCAHARHADNELLENISAQAQRCISQFSAESLALTLRGMAFFGRTDDPIFTRALVELPRVIPTMRPADIAIVCSSFAAAQVNSPFLVDLVSPVILEKAPTFNTVEWLLLLRSYATLGPNKMFLSAVTNYLKVDELEQSQLDEALGFTQLMKEAGEDLAPLDQLYSVLCEKAGE
eukprot:s111_g19.t1